MSSWLKTTLCTSVSLIALLIPLGGFASPPPHLPSGKDLLLVPGNPVLSYRLAYLERNIERLRQEQHVPGLSLVVVKDDKIVYAKGFGYRDVAHKLPATPDTLYAIGSSTKAFTAMTALMSVDDGKMALTDPPRKYLPYFKINDPDIDKNIVLSDLLSHRSGLDRTDLFWYTNRLNPREVIQAAGKIKPTAKLGEKFQYQNVMFLAAGESVAAAQHTPWETFTTKRILQPLGMKATTFRVAEMAKRPDYSLGYEYKAGKKETKPRPTKDIRCIAPAGAINSSVNDMAQWVRFLLNGGVCNGKRLVSEKSFKELFVKRINISGSMDYGYGWFLQEWGGHKIYHHGGNIDGFSAMVGLMPDQKLGLVLLTNLNVTPMPTLGMNTVWKAFVEPIAAKPATTVTAPASDPAQEVGTYRMEQSKFEIVVRLAEGKLLAKPAGQPELPLLNVGGRRYKIAPPAPDGIFVTFRPQSGSPKETELVLDQGGQQFILKKPTGAPFKPPFSSEELMAKVVTAAGGEANLARHKSLRIKYRLSAPTQGIEGEGVVYSRTPNSQAEQTTLTALHKKIALLYDWYDGKQGGSEASFLAASTTKGEKELLDNAVSADFSQELNWKKLFKTVAITNKGKVGDEEVFIVEKTPEKGSKVTDYISMKTFLVLKRDSVSFDPDDGPTPLSETFSDYRSVEGVMVPFKRVRKGGLDMELTVTEVRFDVKIPDTIFHPVQKK